MRRWGAAAVAAVLLCVVLAWEQPAEAGGPLIVGGNFGLSGLPFTWDTAAAVSYHTDLGTLGGLTTAQADTLVQGSFDVWQNVPTAAISFTRTGNLGVDVVGGASDPASTPPKVNHAEFFNAFINNCQPPQPPAPSNAVNAIVYDTDGSITDGILGANQSLTVIGFAGAVCISTDNATFNRITRGRAVLNGKFQDGAGSPNDLSPNQFQQVFTHEFGHLIGLDHSQVNNEVSNQMPANRTLDDLFGLPVMFPVLLSGSPARVDNGFPALAPDDEAWVSALYPDTSFAATFGHIEGQVFFSDGVTPAQGTNLIARLVDNIATAENESRRFAYSSTSGYLFTGNPGQTATSNYLPCTPSTAPACTGGFLGGNAGDNFGSRDPALIGFFRIPLKAGDYTLEVEAIDPDWVDGSRVGPLGGDAGEQFPLPGGTPEFWDAGESATDDPTAKTNISVTVGVTVADRNITLNGTPPRFDAFETAWLRWREPAPAWLRERRPPAFLVAG